MIARRRGVIINNSSVAGLRGMARLSHYAASKWGLVGLTKSWAIELAPHNIRVVVALPDRRQHADERRPGGAGRHDAAARSPSARPATCCRCPGSSRRTWPRPWCSWPPTGPASSPARSSSSTPGCSRGDFRGTGPAELRWKVNWRPARGRYSGQYRQNSDRPTASQT